MMKYLYAMMVVLLSVTMVGAQENPFADLIADYDELATVPAGFWQRLFPESCGQTQEHIGFQDYVFDVCVLRGTLEPYSIYLVMSVNNDSFYYRTKWAAYGKYGEDVDFFHIFEPSYVSPRQWSPQADSTNGAGTPDFRGRNF